jgi:site-specific DNA-cytosine methylase
MQTVELFCGTKSFSKVAEKLGHKTFTVDNNSQHNPDYLIDIMDLKRSMLPLKVDVLWASPPCTCFSVASIGSSWIGNYCPKRVETALGMAYILKTIELIKDLKPKYWFIENPRGVLRKMAFMNEFHRKSVCYCRYGDNRMKPTDIWTNFINWESREMCYNGNKDHQEARRGSKTGTQGLKGARERGVIPESLFYEIFNSINGGVLRI